MGETLEILANAFGENESQKVLVYLSNENLPMPKNVAPHDMLLSAARIQMFLPEYGRFTEIEMPFPSPYEQSVPSNAQFWAAVCIWQEANKSGQMEFRFKKIDMLSVDEPIGAELC